MALNSNNIEDSGIFVWICTLAIMVFVIIIIGGITRLTESGLSMVDWRPIMGTAPPLTNKAWIEIFEKYKLTPEFKIINHSMTIDQFKYIFWWEWFHRFFARCIGLVFIIPLIYFYFKKKLKSNLVKILFFVFILGLIQAIIGWWMVKSGLVNNPYVSAYRLAFHLGVALLIFCILTWLALIIYFGNKKNDLTSNQIKNLFHISLALIFITILSGAFMSGTDSGKSFNTFPLMNNEFIPEGYYLEDYGWKNSFENSIAINFNHRWLGMCTFVFIFVLTLNLYFKKKYNKFSLLLVMFIISLQVFLGILTLIYVVPLSFASLHQANAVVLLASMLFCYNRLIYK